jgi:septal ring factor EnvC (AmiA/AmiB activator)
MDATWGRPLRVLVVALLLLILLIESTAVVGSSAQEAPSPADVEAAERRVDIARDGVAAVAARLQEARSEVAAVRSRIAMTEAEVRRIARRVLRGEDSVIEVAQRMYKDGSGAVLEGLLSAESISELEAGIRYLRSSGQAHIRELETLAVDRKLLESRLDELDAAREEAIALFEEVRQLEASVREELARRREELASVRSARAAYLRRLAELRAAQRAAEQATEEAAVAAAPPSVPETSGSVDWDAIAQCESGGNWALDSQYDGGLQFHPATWLGYGGGRYARYAWQASREEQIAVAERVLAAQGPNAWPNCFQYG